MQRRTGVSGGLALAGVMVALMMGCGPKRQAAGGGKGAAAGAEGRVLMDFEATAEATVRWEGAEEAAGAGGGATTQAGAAGVSITRVSGKASSGVWALQVTVPAGVSGRAMSDVKGGPVDLRGMDQLEMAVAHGDVPSRSATFAAAVTATDISGHTLTGDYYPLFSKYQTIGLELGADGEGVQGGEPFDFGRVASIGLAIKPLEGANTAGPATEADGGLRVLTDSWAVRKETKTYVSQRMAPVGLDAQSPNTFYAERHGGRIEVGVRGGAGGYEIEFRNGSTFGNSHAPPYLAVRDSSGRLVMGQANTGLSLLGSTQGPGMELHTDPAPQGHATLESLGFNNAPSAPAATPGLWPGKDSLMTFECTWASPVAVLVEGKEQVGPFDRLSRPAAEVTWRFMIYQWGQVFVHAEWTADSDTLVKPPTSWALALDEGLLTADSAVDAHSAADADRLLTAVYPQAFHANGAAVGGTLPHQMQPGAPVAMLGKTLATMDKPWWWAKPSTGSQRIFGSAILSIGGGENGHAPLDAMLLVNAPGALTQAGSFSAYLSPPRLRIRQGELDRNFPGDPDNDGFVDSYGFQVIRLAAGRAAFTVYPDNRPLFYPAFLFTVPAVERAADDLPHARLLINVDGQQFADPPQFPDGSFLLQLPYVLNRPVLVEAVLVKK